MTTAANEHTPEPWESVTNGTRGEVRTVERVSGAPIGMLIAKLDSYAFTQQQCHANAARIVACVNACTNLDNPAQAIERYKRIEAAAKKALDRLENRSGGGIPTLKLNDAVAEQLRTALEAQ